MAMKWDVSNDALALINGYGYCIPYNFACFVEASWVSTADLISLVAFCPYINMDYTVIPEQIRRKMYLGRSSAMMICFDKAMTAP
ncbi:hypothetical protein AAG906_033460 [Vitis piasezkii]